MNRRDFNLAALTTLITPTFSFADTAYTEPKAAIYPCNLSRELTVDIDDKFLDTFASWKGKYLSADGVMNGEQFKLYCTKNRREILVRLSNNFEFRMYEIPEYLKMNRTNRSVGFSLVVMGDFYQNTIYFQSAKDRQVIAELICKTFSDMCKFHVLAKEAVAMHENGYYTTLESDNFKVTLI